MDTLTLLGGRATTREALGLATTDSPTLANLTLSGGTLTGGASGVTVAAGGTNQPAKISPSGTGAIVLFSANDISFYRLGAGSLGLGTGAGGLGSLQLLSVNAYNGGINTSAGSLGYYGNTNFGLLSGTVQAWNSDTGLSRLNAASLALGNGAAGNTGGTLSLATLIFSAPSTPASAAATGTVGTIKYDSDYIYVCVATNTWKRAALTTW